MIQQEPEYSADLLEDPWDTVSGIERQHQRRLPRSISGLAPFFLIFSATTVPVDIFNPQIELRRSGAVSALRALGPRRRRRLPLREAREIALQIMETAERQLQAERHLETHLLLSFDNEAFFSAT